MTRRWLILVAALATAVTLVVIVQPATHASAELSGSEFRAGNIISDAEFYNANAMTAGQVQTFLNEQYQGCATGYTCLRDYTTKTASRPAESGLCNAYTGRTSETSAQIIVNVGRACGVNPQVLLVMLQKESGLVTATAPSTGTYNTAMGYNCPDDTGCASSSYGFFVQVYGAARSFKHYRLYPDNYGYVAGRSNYIQYNPKTSCGGSNVYIENQATAGLYDYTPYQPNAAALKNLRGTGDSCSAYGNRNFWVFYHTWFTPPSTPYDAGGLVASKPNGTLWYYRNSGNAAHPYDNGVQVGNSGWQGFNRILSGDIDGDGIADLVATKPTGSLWLYRNNGTSLPYGGARNIGAYGWDAFNRIVLADVDGNGLADLVATKPDGSLWLYRNNGNATHPYSASVRIGAYGWGAFTRLALGDVDNDGRADMVGIKSDGSLWLYRNTGTANHPFGAAVKIGAYGWGAFDKVLVGDINSDGRADIVATKPNGTLWLYLASSNVDHPYSGAREIGLSGWQAFSHIALTAVPVPRRTETADLTAIKPAGTLWSYKNDPYPAPYFGPTRIGASGWNGFAHIASGDVNGDNAADVVGAKPDGTLWYYKNTGNSSAPLSRAEKIGASGWQAFTHIVAGDVDGGGRADLVAIKKDGSLWLYRAVASSSRPFAAGIKIGAYGWEVFNRVAIGDVNGDNRADLVLTKPDGSLWIYYAGATATHPFGSATRVAATGWQGTTHLMAGDVDGNGLADIVAVDPAGRLTLYRNGNAELPFGAGTVIAPSGWNMYDVIVAADLDKDGLPDLVVRRPDGSLWAYRDRGVAAFAAGKMVGASGWEKFDKVAAGDVNGDGRADLVLTTPEGALRYYQNSGHSNQPYSTGSVIGWSGWQGFERIMLGDVNGDGLADLVATKTSGSLWLYVNRGNTTTPFSGAVELASGGWAGFVTLTLADVNGDGLADLIGTKSDGSLWYCTAERGADNPFPSANRISSGGWSYDVLAGADVDHDGYADLVGRKPDGTLWLVRNSGGQAPLFSKPAPLGAGWQVYSHIVL